MSVSSVGGTSPQAMPHNSQAMARTAKKAEDGSAKEITTVSVHCKKEHEHDQSCEATVSTKPAPESGEIGSLVDESV